MSKKNAEIKAGFGYTLGNVLIKGINFITLPLFSRILTTAEFGVYNVFISYDAILSVLVSLAVHTSVRSAHYEFKKTNEYVSSVSLIFVLNALLCLLVIALGGQRLAEAMGFSETTLLLLVPYSFGSAVIQLYNARISIDYEYKKYLIVSVANSLGNVGVSLLLIMTVFRSQKDVGRIIGTTATMFGLAVILLFSLYRKARPRFNSQFWKFAVLYSLPIVPHGISQVLLGQCDRIMISNMVSNSAAGIYSLAGNLKLVLTVITTSIGTVWSTWFFSKMESGEKEEITKNSFFLVDLFLIFTVGLMSISPELINILGGAEYEAGKYVAVPMIMDAFIIFLYNIVVPSEYYTQKTKYITIGTMVATIINLVTNYIFIKMFGFVAAAYTTLFSYICYLLLHAVISKRLVKFEVISWKCVLASSLIVAASGVFTLCFIGNIVLRYVCCMVAVIALCPPLVKYCLTLRKKP